jgi:multiple sugar transport system substrate-binding protein
MPDIEGQVTRRDVLKKGLLGAAGLTILPSVIAACGGSSASPTPPPAPTPAPATPGPADTPAPATPAPGLTGSVTLGSNLSDAVPKQALADAIALFTTANAGVTVKVNTVDHSTFQDTISNYLQGTPDDVLTWFSGFRMRAFVVQGLFTPIDDVWAKIGANYTAGFKAASTGDDGKLYFVPWATYAWTIYYRKDVWAAKNYTIPTTLADMLTLAAKMKADGLVPIGLGDKDGWPAMGHFDIINLRENGYQFHVDLMAGKAKWTDAKTKQVFTVWKTLLPFYQTAAAGRIWQDAAKGLVAKTTGMMLQPQVAETFTAAGAADYAQLAMFPWPHHGTQWDAEEALDAPIDGFMISAKSSNLAADMANAKALMQHLSTGAAQGIAAKANPANIACATDTVTTGYTDLQKAQVAVLAKAQKLTQFLDRDTKPAFAGAQGMQGFLIDFLQKPDQDLDAFLKKIQTYWDSLA